MRPRLGSTALTPCRAYRQYELRVALAAVALCLCSRAAGSALRPRQAFFPSPHAAFPLRPAARRAISTAAIGRLRCAASSNLRSLTKWAASRGMRVDGWRVGDVGGGVRGGIADADIPEGFLLVSAPHDAVLSAREDDPCPLPDSFVEQAYWDGIYSQWDLFHSFKFGNTMRLALRLLYEKQLGPQSTWAPYIDSLPRDLLLPVSYSAAELEELHYPPLIGAIRGESEFWEQKWKGLSAAMPSPPAREDFYWALSCVMSRAFSFDGGKDNAGRRLPAVQLMFPFADMLNHDNTAGMDFRFDHTKQQFELYNPCAKLRGQEIVHSYGDATVEHLLQFYGFVPPDSEKYFVSVCERELWYSSKEVDAEKEDALEDDILSLRMTLLSALIKGFKEDPSSPAVVPLKSLRGTSIITTEQQHGHPGHAGLGYPFKVGGRDIENSLMIYARTLVVTNEDHANLGMRGLLTALASNQTACISPHNELAALRLLDKVLTSQLHSMHRMSSLADDAVLLDRLEAGGGVAASFGGDEARTNKDRLNMALCLRYRMQRKQTLAGAIELVHNMRQKAEGEFVPAVDNSRAVAFK